jgi:hypothetical protein
MQRKNERKSRKDAKTQISGRSFCDLASLREKNKRFGNPKT